MAIGKCKFIWIYFKLSKPVFLKSQVEDLAEKTGFPLDDLMKVACFSRSVMAKDAGEHKKGEVVPLFTGNHPGEEPVSLYGPDGVAFICREYGVEAVPVSEVNIPYEVYFECPSDRVWLSVSYFAAKLERHSSYVAKYAELGAPDIIICNEWRILQENAQSLETNDGPGQERWDDGIVMRSLSDVGYSLATGWIPEKLEVFRLREERMEEADLDAGEEEENDGE